MFNDAGWSATIDKGHTGVEHTSLTLFNLRRHSSSEVPHVFYVLKVFADFSWAVYVGNRMVCGLAVHIVHCMVLYNYYALPTSPFLVNGPDLLDSSAKVFSLLKALLVHRLCPGNCDSKFDVLSQSRKGIFKDIKGIL